MDEAVRRHGRSRRPEVEPLEQRTLLTTAGPGMLLFMAPPRSGQALLDANQFNKLDVTARTADLDHDASPERETAEFHRAAFSELLVVRADSILTDPSAPARTPAAAGRPAAPGPGDPTSEKAAPVVGPAAEMLASASPATQHIAEDRASAGAVASQADQVEVRPEAEPFVAADPPDRSASPGLSARVGALLECGLPFDAALLQRNVDEFFTCLSRIGEGGEPGPLFARFGPWLVVLTTTTLATVRIWQQRFNRRAAPCAGSVPGRDTWLSEEE